MLILFDIDATLLRTGGAGLRAMRAAGAALFGPKFSIEGVSFSGRLDPLILADLLRANEVEATPQNCRRMRDVYEQSLPAELGAMTTPGVLPGVNDLLGVLSRQQSHVLGVLTGNFPETGRLKLRACGVKHEHFAIHVWGDDSPHEPPRRSDLPPIARQRFERQLGRAIAFEQITIIGDSPADVQCARENGCRCLGVATGQSSATELKALGAHHVVGDLTATDEIARWLLAG